MKRFHIAIAIGALAFFSLLYLYILTSSNETHQNLPSADDPLRSLTIRSTNIRSVPLRTTTGTFTRRNDSQNILPPFPEEPVLVQMRQLARQWHLQADISNELVESVSKVRVLVYKEKFSYSVERASAGGPAGELILFRSLLRVLFIWCC